MGDFFISSETLKTRMEAGEDIVLLDVRKPEAYRASGLAMPGAGWRDPFSVTEWASEISGNTSVVVYCVHGHEVSQGVGKILQAGGADVRVLEGGFEGWRESGGVTVPAPETEAS